MKLIITILLALLTLELAFADAGSIYSDVESYHSTEKYIVFTGVAVKKTNYNFVVNKVYEPDQEVIFRGINESLFLDVTTPDLLIGKDNSFSLMFNFGYQEFKLDKQVINNDEVDLGTSIEGKYLYVMPILAFNYGHRAKVSRPLNGFRALIGGGLGYVSTKGNAVFNGSFSGEPEEFEYNSVMLASLMQILYMYNGFTVGMKMTEVRTGLPDGAWQVLHLKETSLDLGYSFGF